MAAHVEAPETSSKSGPRQEHRTSKKRRLPRWLVGLLAASPPIIVVGIFVGFPILVAAAYSLGHVGGLNSTIATIARGQHTVEHWYQMTGGAYVDVFTNPGFRRNLFVTVTVTLIVTAAIVALAWLIALYLRMAQSRWARMLSGLAVTPIFIPVVIASWAILTFYSSDGFVRTMFSQFGVEAPAWGYTLVSVCIGLVWHHLPFAVLMITSGLQGVPDSLIEAARDSGATITTIVRTIFLPLTLVPTVIALTFTAIESLGSFTIPYLTGPSSSTMLGVEMTSYFTSYNRPQQSVVMALTVFVIAAVFGAFYVWANFRSAQQTRNV